MADDEIRYDLLTQDALRGVIRKVLSLVQRTGLPGQHHLYIAFDTEAEGVQVSKRLKDLYPDEMTIVLQYQFWDLQVTNDRFEVKLSFGSVPERLVVPFQAVKSFYDPSAQFGLQFGKHDVANDLARQQMAAALAFRGYEFQFAKGTGGHDGKHGGAILPDTLRWLWSDVKP